MLPLVPQLVVYMWRQHIFCAIICIAGKQSLHWIYETKRAALFGQWTPCWVDVTCIYIFLKTCLHHRGRRTVISMPVQDSSSSSTLAWSHRQNAVILERSPSPDKKPKRQSTHLKTLYPLYHILRKKFWTVRHCSGETNGIIMNIMWLCGSSTDD